MDETNIRSDILKLPEENIKRLFDIHFGIEFFWILYQKQKQQKGFQDGSKGRS